MRSSVTKAASVAIPLASLISLTACRGVVVAASPVTAGTTAALATTTTVPPATTGGTFTIDHTGDDGRTLDATVSWTCP